MKILAVCEGGNCRSVATALLLKCNGYDALACSWKDNSPETLAMLYEWAGAICVMEEYMAEKIPDQHRHKLTVIDVGPDRWCNPFDGELLGIIGHYLNHKPLNVERPIEEQIPA